MASSFEKSVKGATKIKLAAPKSKYIEHILVATHAGEAGVGEVFRALQNRLRDSTWTIVFKALIVVHLMIREGEPDVTLKYLAQAPRRRLAINHFTDEEQEAWFRSVQTQGRNIRAYSEYLYHRALAFGATKIDYVRSGEGRLKKLTIDKGLLRETESVQEQIDALLQCDFMAQEPDNEITLTAFRLLTMDLLALFHVMNEGTINVLEHYFEMSHPDATRALVIYRRFAVQTDQVVQYLSVARHFEHATRLEIPKIKHAPTSLTASLEEYLNDKDFEINRRQYLAQLQAKKGTKPTNGASSKPVFDFKSATSASKPVDSSFPDPKPSSNAPAQQQPKGPAPDLIDFFESIEQNQTFMAQPTQPYQQPQYAPQPTFQQQATGYPTQETGFANGGELPSSNPFGQPQQQPQPQPIQTNFTGAGFGGYTPQPQHQPAYGGMSSPLSSIPQDSVASFPPQMQQSQPQFNLPQQQTAQPLQPQSTNPFRQSMMPPTVTGMSTSSFGGNPSLAPTATGLNRAATNPFAKQSISPSATGSPFAASPPTVNVTGSMPFTPPPNTQTLSPLQPAPTGTNPFARVAPQQVPQNPNGAPQGAVNPAAQQLSVHATGSTNPFRQSAFVNQQTGQGWQHGMQGTMGGLEQLDTVPIFPRPGQAQQQSPNQGQGWS